MANKTWKEIDAMKDVRPSSIRDSSYAFTGLAIAGNEIAVEVLCRKEEITDGGTAVQICPISIYTLLHRLL